MALDNLSQNVTRVHKRGIAENGAGTYVYDVFIPARSIILDIQVHAQALWAAATSAALICGDYAASFVDGSPVIGAAIDDDGFIASTNLKATDLLAGESIGINGIAVQGGKGGAYVTVGTNTHVTQRSSTSDRFVRFSITSVGAGTTGRTICLVEFAPAPSAADITQ